MRRFLFAFIILALLLRSTAGLTMQVSMAHSMAVASSTAQKTASPPCHTEMQAGMLSAATNDATPKAAASNDCQLCCVTAALPSSFVFQVMHTQHDSPFSQPFSNQPASAQRPSKPPLI